MHMEPVQRYVINMTKEEAAELYQEIGKFSKNQLGEQLNELYHLLDIWVGS